MNLKFLTKPLGLISIIVPTCWTIYIINLTENNEVRFSFISDAFLFLALCLASSLIIYKEPPSPKTDLKNFKRRKRIIAGILLLAALLNAASTLFIFFVLKSENAF